MYFCIIIGDNLFRNSMQKLLNHIIHIGVKPDTPLHEQDRVLKLNKLYLLTIPACIMGSVWSYDSLWFVAISLSICLLMQLAIVMHHFGYYQTANIYSNLVFNVICTVLAFAFNGKTGTENYLFVSIFTIQVQFYRQKGYLRFVLSGIVFLLFLGVKIANCSEHSHLPIPSLWYIIYVQNICVIFFLLMFLMHEYMSMITHYQEKIEDQNEILAKKQTELIVSNQVKDQLFAIIGHDLSKPIASVKGIITLLTQKLLTPEQEIKYLNLLTNLLNSTDLTLKNLLDWGLQQNKLSDRATLSIHQEVEQNIELLSAIANQKNIEINNLVEKEAFVFVDKYQFSFILRNLIANGLKFTHPNGKIQISTEDLGESWLISVEDNGVGMSEEQIDKLFNMEKRYTTQGTAKEIGTGLGLPLCKQFVENQLGVLKISSEVSKGSTFAFTMPKREDGASARQKKTS